MTKSDFVQETDPAKELADLFSQLNKHNPKSTDSTLAVISTFLAIEPSNSLLYELLGIIAQRTNNMKDFIENLRDEHLDDETRASLLHGLNSAVQIINPINLNTRWDTVRSNIVDHNIIILRSFSQTARRYKPLRAVSYEEVQAIIEKIDEAFDEVNQSTEIPEWALSSVREGLRRLKLMITYLNVFGHEAIIDYVIKMHGDAIVVSSFLETHGFQQIKGLFKVAAVIATIINIFVAPVRGYEGYLGYKQHGHEMIKIMPKLLGGTQRLLPPPTNNSTDFDLKGP